MAYINRNKIPAILRKGDKGDKGDNAFIRYSANADGTDFTEEWSEGQNYIGFATGQTAPTDKSGHTWVAFGNNQSENGGGVSQIIRFFKDTEYTKGGFITQTGGISPNGRWAYSGYLEIMSNATYWLNIAYQATGAYYDKDKNFISNLWVPDGGTNKTKYVFITPENVRYIRINTLVETLETQCIGIGDKPLSDEEINLYREQTIKSQWGGKKFVTLGDSITWQDGKEYQQGADVGKVAKGYQYHIKKALGFSAYDNYGVSGRPMANGTANGDGTNTTAKTVDYTGYDLCIIAAGTNDFKLNVALGTLGVMGETAFDTNTFYGALRDTIEHILTAKPTIRLCLFTPLQRNNGGYDVNTENTEGHKLIDYAEAIKAVGEMYSVPVCDMYANSGISKLTLSTYTMDGLHPNESGYNRMGGYAAKFIDIIGV